jgi:hypothetical protein
MILPTSRMLRAMFRMMRRRRTKVRIILHLLRLSLTMSEARRQSKRLAKGKAPVRPSADVRVSGMGTKESVGFVGEDDDIMDADEDNAAGKGADDADIGDEDVDMESEMNDPMPHTYKPSQEFKVVIESPPNRRPKKQYRLNEAGASKPAQDSEKSEVGCEGEVRRIPTFMRPHTLHIFRICVRRARRRYVRYASRSGAQRSRRGHAHTVLSNESPVYHPKHSST